MKITTLLSLKYLRKNKRKSIFSIVGLALTMAIFTITFILLCSYQEYVTNIMRHERNYEAEFANITYKNAQEIKKDKNIKEISITQHIGTSEENFSNSTTQGSLGSIMRIDIIALDENAKKNDHIELMSGRWPNNTHEIVIGAWIPSEGIFLEDENSTDYMGKKITITIDGKKEVYEIVGRARNLRNSSGGFSAVWIIPALTYFDEDSFTEDTNVDVSILTNNIQKIYETTNGLAKNLNLYKTEEEKNTNLKYYTNLLHYELVKVPETKEKPLLINAGDENTKEFAGDLRNIVIVLIVIISSASIIVIYTTFKMTYRERIKELGILSSIGMDKKQKKKLLLKEALIITTIAIIIGIVIGSIISFVEIKYLSILASKTTEVQGAKILFDPNVEMYMVFPIVPIFAGILLTYIIAIISSLIPMRKINKISPIEAIRHTNESDIKQKNMKTPKIISKVFKQEGELAYKNIRKDKSRYKTIVISIVTSIVCFITINQLTNIKLFYQYGRAEKEQEQDINYSITLFESNKEKEANLINKLKEKGLINTYLIADNMNMLQNSEMVISTTSDRITKVGNIMAQNNRISLKNIGNEVLLGTRISTLSGDVYNELLEKVGIEKLNENECILINKAFDTKYENKENITNYSKGETIVLKELDKKIIEQNIILTNEEKEKKKQEEEFLNEVLKDFGGATSNETTDKNTELINNRYDLKIAAVAEESIQFFSSEYNSVILIVNPETYKKIASAENTDAVYDEEIKGIYIDSDNPEKIDEEIRDIEGASGTNFNKFYEESYSIDLIEKIVIYTFIILIALFSCINICNTIFSSIILRKKEFAMLKSIGMDNRQINKMLFLEMVFYGLDAIIYGILISLVILYIMYIALIETIMYNFYIPIENMILCIVISYIVIFLSIVFAKRRINNQNIIDDVRNEAI